MYGYQAYLKALLYKIASVQFVKRVQELPFSSTLMNIIFELVGVQRSVKLLFRSITLYG